MPIYEEEILGTEDDDGTMVRSKNDLAQAVIGHKIVEVRQGVKSADGFGGPLKGATLVLDNGQEVEMVGVGDCCAYTEVETFLLNADLVDHVIIGVGTTDKYNTWHIYADAGDVLKLTVGWSCGNPFYYGYGFNIRVKP